MGRLLHDTDEDDEYEDTEDFYEKWIDAKGGQDNVECTCFKGGPVPDPPKHLDLTISEKLDEIIKWKLKYHKIPCKSDGDGRSATISKSTGGLDQTNDDDEYELTEPIPESDLKKLDVIEQLDEIMIWKIKNVKNSCTKKGGESIYE